MITIYIASTADNEPEDDTPFTNEEAARATVLAFANADRKDNGVALLSAADVTWRPITRGNMINEPETYYYLHHETDNDDYYYYRKATVYESNAEWAEANR